MFFEGEVLLLIGGVCCLLFRLPGACSELLRPLDPLLRASAYEFGGFSVEFSGMENSTLEGGLGRDLERDLPFEFFCCCCWSCLFACLVAALTIPCFLYTSIRALGVGFLLLLRMSSQSLALCSGLKHLGQKFLTLSGESQISWRLLSDGVISIAVCITSSDWKLM